MKPGDANVSLSTRAAAAFMLVFFSSPSSHEIAMLAGIASLIFIPLLAIFFAHVVWAFGGAWPVRDRALLARTINGYAGVTRVSRLAAAGFAIGAFAAGIVALNLSDPVRTWPLSALGFALTAGFALRGGLAYTQFWVRLTPEEPFRSLDRKVYAPLSLALAAGFLILTISGIA